MVSLVSSGLVIARPHGKGNSPAVEFVPFSVNANLNTQRASPVKLGGPASRRGLVDN